MRLTPGAEVTDPSQVDLADPGLYADGDPHAVWQALRRSGRTVRWQPVAGRPGFWAVTGYAESEAILSDHATFTSTHGVMLNLLGRQEPAHDQQFAATDPPRHGRLRGPLQRRMTVRAVAGHAEHLRAHVRSLFEPGDFDLAAVTARLPMAFLGPLMGIPHADWPALSRWVAMSVAEHDPDVALPGGPQSTLDRGHREMFAYLMNLALAHRRRPRGDLVDVLLGMDLGAGAVVANCYSLLLGASAAIPHVPTGTVGELLRTGTYHAWAARPDLLPGAVEEALRFTSPAGHFLRVATRDTHVGGAEVKAGDAVVVWIGSANRDETVFADPHRLRPQRSPNRHLAFGDGHHYCLGATVARLALRIFFEELFLRYEDLAPAGPVEHIRSTWLAGIKRMPVHGRPR